MKILTEADQCVDEIIQQIGKNIVLATPLGLGKPIQLLNALYRRCKQDATINLTVVTALSLTRPRFSHELERRLLGPFIDRVYGDYEDLDWEIDRRQEALPNNVRIVEFFFMAGAYRNNPSAQQNFVSSNFTHVMRDVMPLGVNVFAPMVAMNGSDVDQFSLSSNTDLAHELLTKSNVLVVGQINKHLPYMFGRNAELSADRFHAVLDSVDGHKKLFSIPKQPLTARDHIMGLFVSSLIEDDGCLQLGIGSVSDAIVLALILRHKHNVIYQQLLERVALSSASTPFDKGLFAATEMLLDGYLELYRHGILKKEVTDEQGSFIAHAGFFLGSSAFYDALNKMPEEERKRFSMRGVGEINQLYGGEERRRRERKNARFINNAMMVSLFGEAISDTLASGLTVSGVGGQYNFVAMAHELEDARSIIICPSVRETSTALTSNVIFSGSFVTIPRHLRDVVVTEYGIADLRGKTDQNVIKAMLNVADSRFQKRLMKEAQRSGKLPPDYAIPSRYQNNFPEKNDAIVKDFANLLTPFPFGTEFGEIEQSLVHALSKLKQASSWQKVRLVLHGSLCRPNSDDRAKLARMNLAHTYSLKEALYRRVILGALHAS